MNKRWLFIPLVALLTVCTLLAFVNPQATYAASTVLSCDGTSSTTYDPPITTTEHTVKFRANRTLGPCVVPTNLSLTGGTSFAEATFPASCLNLLDASFQPGTATFNWNDPAQSHSVVVFTTSVVSTTPTGDLLVTQTGSVTSGFGEGSTAVSTVTLATADVTGCETHGVASLAGPFTLTFG